MIRLKWAGLVERVGRERPAGRTDALSVGGNGSQEHLD